MVGDIEIEPDVRIDGQVTITGRVKIGRGSHIATGARIFGGHGITIGKHSGIGPGSTLLSATDDPDSDKIALHAESTVERAERAGQIEIGDYVLICAHCVVLPRTVIRNEVILGALSMAKGELLAGRIYGGVPAVEIRHRAQRLKYAA